MTQRYRTVTRQPLFDEQCWRPGLRLDFSIPKEPPRLHDLGWRLVSAVHHQGTEWGERELVCYWETDG